MTDSWSPSDRGFARPSSSRTQGEAFGGAKGEPEDAEMRRAGRIIRAGVDRESVI
jgi:hypothetical protein